MERQITFRLVRLVIQRVPMMLKVALLNILRLSPVTGKQDLQVELTVRFIRSFFNWSSSPDEMQKRSLYDEGVKGPMWVSNARIPRPGEDDVLDALRETIEHLGDKDVTYEVPEIRPVEAEWTGHRNGVNAKTPPPEISEEAKYERLMEDIEEDITILYFHGGAYHMMDPASHRQVTSKLAKTTGGRCFSVRYRLAPQNPFPAAVLDALVAYLALVSPPEGSMHKPVPANKIVIAGDSAGAGLSLALLQTLLTLRRINRSVRFHGKEVSIELPAGVSTCSPYGDITRSLPSQKDNTPYDYLIAPPQEPGKLYEPYPFPPDSTWPASPPRVEMYANANALIHPLVSPVSGPSKIWENSPPVFMTMGQECLEDDAIYLARKIHQQGGTVVLERFEAKPHCFAILMPNNLASQRCFQGWADFCVHAVKGEVRRSGKALFFDHTGKKVEYKSLDGLGDLSDEEVQRLLVEGKDWRVERENELVAQWKLRSEQPKM